MPSFLPNISILCLLKKASCLFQHTHRIKCDFSYAPKINALTGIDFADTSLYRPLAFEIPGISNAS
jgi:hypothetical protein